MVRHPAPPWRRSAWPPLEKVPCHGAEILHKSPQDSEVAATAAANSRTEALSCRHRRSEAAKRRGWDNIRDLAPQNGGAGTTSTLFAVKPAMSRRQRLFCASNRPRCHDIAHFRRQTGAVVMTIAFLRLKSAALSRHRQTLVRFRP